MKEPEFVTRPNPDGPGWETIDRMTGEVIAVSEVETCQNCKHWYTDDPSQIQIIGRGICLKANCVQQDDHRMLANEKSQAHALTTVASAFGYEMAINQLETALDFGCNQFETK